MIPDEYDWIRDFAVDGTSDKCFNAMTVEQIEDLTRWGLVERCQTLEGSNLGTVIDSDADSWERAKSECDSPADLVVWTMDECSKRNAEMNAIRDHAREQKRKSDKKHILKMVFWVAVVCGVVWLVF